MYLRARLKNEREILIKKSCAKAFSLLEILLVVAVGSVFILASLKVYSNVTDARYVQEQADVIRLLKEASFSLYSGFTNFSGLDNGVLVNNGYVPEEYWLDYSGSGGSNVIRVPAGDRYAVTPRGTNNEMVGISTRRYDPDLCGSLILKVANDPNLREIRIPVDSLVISVSPENPVRPGDVTSCQDVADAYTQGILFLFAR